MSAGREVGTIQGVAKAAPFFCQPLQHAFFYLYLVYVYPIQNVF
jgi:hypothetical protein